MKAIGKGLWFGLLLCISCISISLASDKKPDTVRVGISYIPNVQFAPFYVAQEKGFYAESNLEVQMEYGYENDFVALAAQGAREFAAASGDQVILARSNGIPIVYVMKWYQRYPVALVSPKSKGIKSLTNLSGKSVGIPGFFGASYVGWKALVYSSGIDETKVMVKQIGFTQASAIQQGVVDAAIVYIVNEPIQLKNAGVALDIIEVSDQIDLVSNGLLVGEKLIRENPQLVDRMVDATLKGLAYSIDHPEETFVICRKAIPEITDKEAPVQFEVLKASIELWKSSQMGVSSRKSWQESVDFMSKTGLLNHTVDIDSLYTNRFVNN